MSELYLSIVSHSGPVDLNLLLPSFFFNQTFLKNMWVTNISGLILLAEFWYINFKNWSRKNRPIVFVHLKVLNRCIIMSFKVVYNKHKICNNIFNYGMSGRWKKGLTHHFAINLSFASISAFWCHVWEISLLAIVFYHAVSRIRKRK